MQTTMTTIDAAQSDMRHGYLDGAPGMFVSAAVWASAALVTVNASPRTGVLALLIGGMLIHPLSLLLCRACGRPAKHSRGNPLAALALATTAWLILSLPLAYVVSLQRIDWFFPAMLCVIGGRYLCFQTLYGLRAYLACGGVLAVAAFLLVRLGAEPVTGAFAGAAIEAVFATVILIGARAASATRAAADGRAGD